MAQQAPARTPKQVLQDKLLEWLVNHPNHAVRLGKARKRVRSWLR